MQHRTEGGDGEQCHHDQVRREGHQCLPLGERAEIGIGGSTGGPPEPEPPDPTDPPGPTGSSTATLSDETISDGCHTRSNSTRASAPASAAMMSATW